jgi:putative transposase
MKLVAKDLKAIYTSASESEALQALEALEQNWGKLYPTVPEIWRRNWVHIVTFLAYPDFMRKAIYTTNSIEAVNRQIRKVIKTKGLFPNDQAAIKLVFLACQPKVEMLHIYQSRNVTPE